jgi:hypothetical protein
MRLFFAKGLQGSQRPARVLEVAAGFCGFHPDLAPRPFNAVQKSAGIAITVQRNQCLSQMSASHVTHVWIMRLLDNFTQDLLGFPGLSLSGQRSAQRARDLVPQSGIKRFLQGGLEFGLCFPRILSFDG